MLRHAVFLTLAWMVLGTASAPAQNWVASVFPERAYDFGTVARGSKIRHAFKVVNTTAQDIHISDWRTKCGCTDVRVGARQIPPGTQTVVEATIDTSRFQGYKASGLTLVLDRPQYREVDLNLTCFIRNDVLLNPGQVDFGVVTRKSKPTVTLTLSYLGGQTDWAVTKMETIKPLVSAHLRELERSPGSALQYQLTVTLDPAAPSGYFKDEITLLTNDPSSPKIPITVSANVQAAVTVSPSILVIGRVQPGQVVKKTILVRSSQPFKVTEIDAKAGEIEASGVSDAARALHSVTLTFSAPKQVGSYNGTVEISTDLKDEPPAKLSVFATIAR
jgi:hypothetical protein